ncbi:hypothetical protein NKG94_23650 [Micromonospora sp. M12]
MAGTEEGFPLLSANASRFVILPWQALPERTTTPVPTSLLVAGDSLDAEKLRLAGDQGQERYQRDGTVTGRERPIGVTVDTRANVRRDLGDGGRTGCWPSGSWPAPSVAPCSGCWPSRSPCWPARGPGVRCCPAAHPRPVPSTVARAAPSS